MKALFIAPNDFRTSIGGSSNRMQQTSSLLKNAGFEVDLLIVGPGKASHINIEITKKNLGPRDVVIEDKFDLIFCNYLFLLERLRINHEVQLICDIHDDVIDRDKRLNANWITRSQDEVDFVFSRLKPKLLHISPLEMRFYESRFQYLDQFWLPYMPQMKSLPLNGKAESDFSLGFIGTQNSVNANAVVNISRIIDAMDQPRSVLLAGSICQGITSAPDYMHLVPNINISSFYESIGFLLCPIFDQSGASTKLLESLMLGTPVLAPGSLFEGCGMEAPVLEVNSNEDFVELLKHDEHFYIIDQQTSGLDRYISDYKTRAASFSNFLRGR